LPAGALSRHLRGDTCALLCGRSERAQRGGEKKLFHFGRFLSPPIFDLSARARLLPDGRAVVQAGTQDIGTGTYTIMAQVAADMLGLPIDNVTVKLGDSSLPQAQVEGGSWTAASVAHAIAATADEIRRELLGLAQKMPGLPMAGLKPDDVVLADGMIAARKAANRSVSLADAMRHGGVDRVEREKLAEFAEDTRHARNTHSAIFAEVKVDEQLGVIRVTRIVNAVAAGRILNTKTAHSQVLGSVVWGIGMALHEETLVDHHFGRLRSAITQRYPKAVAKSQFLALHIQHHPMFSSADAKKSILATP
jgi:xanthine dehydrogenase YagR molybdenum-binding subunit